MILGSMKELLLADAKDAFLLDCHAVGYGLQTRRVYRDILNSFISFTGNMCVRELGPDHVRMYIADLADRPRKGQKHARLLRKHYAVIRAWIRWMYCQKLILERSSSFVKAPRLRNLFSHLSTRSLDIYMPKRDGTELYQAL